MKIAELRAKSREELQTLVSDLKKERFNLRMQDSTGQLENRSRFRETRKTIARAMTVLNEKPVNPGAGRGSGQKKAEAKETKIKKTKKA